MNQNSRLKLFHVQNNAYIYLYIDKRNMAVSRYNLEALFVVLSLISNASGFEMIDSSISPSSTSKAEETVSLSTFGQQGIRLMTLFEMKHNCYYLILDL